MFNARRFCIAVAVSLSLIPSLAAAQTSRSSLQPYVVGGVSLVQMMSGREESPYLIGLLGGTTGGVSAAVGVAASRFGVEGGARVSGEISAQQQNRVFSFMTHHRDVLFTIGVRFFPARSRLLSIEPHAAPAIGFGSERYTNAFELRFGRPPAPVSLPGLRRFYAGCTGGVDLLARVHPRVRMGASTHVAWLQKRTHQPAGPRTGLGPMVYEVGVTVRVDVVK